jgi:O-antigen/teichoic acid export membrane protein
VRVEASETQSEAEAASGGSILANAGFRAIADVGSKIASIALYIVMARKLGDSGFGVFTFGMAFVTLVTMLANMGQPLILTREVARDHRRFDEYFVNTLSLQLALSVPALALALGLHALVGFESETRTVVLLLGIAVVAEALMTTCFAVFQAYERLGFIPVVLISQRWGTAAIGITALALGAGVVTVSAIYLGGAIGALLLALYCVVTRIARPRFVVQVGRWLPLMRVALPVGIAGVFAAILFRIDIAMLGAYESDAVVGQYGAAYRLLESTLFISWSIGAGVYPVLSRLSRTTETPIGSIFQAALKLGLALTLPLAVGAVVLADPLMELLYGPEFRDGASALMLLAPTVVLYPLTYIAAYVLISQDRQSVLAWVYAAATVLNIALNAILIPRYSLDGPAFATSVCEALTAGLMLAFALRASGALDWRAIAVGPLVASALAGGTMAVLHGQVVAAMAASAIVYIGALMLLERRFHPEDYERVMSFARRGASARRSPDPEQLQA